MKKYKLDYLLIWDILLFCFPFVLFALALMFGWRMAEFKQFDSGLSMYWIIPLIILLLMAGNFDKYRYFNIELDNDMLCFHDCNSKKQIKLDEITRVIVVHEFIGFLHIYSQKYMLIYGQDKQLLRIPHPSTAFIRALKDKVSNIQTRTSGIRGYICTNICFAFAGFILGVIELFV